MKGKTLSPFTTVTIPRALFSFTLLVLITANITLAYGEPKARQYDIPPGSLATVLNSIGETSDLQVIYDTRLTQGINSKGLSGSYNADAALHKLLSGTGLSYILAGGTVTIQAAEKSAKSPVKPIVPVTNPKKSELLPETTLEKVTVEADAYNPDWATNPFNPDYVQPDATTGTRTDTPIMETPLNVQVITKQVLRDQQVIRLDQALKNVSGVITGSAATQTTSDANGGIIFLYAALNPPLSSVTVSGLRKAPPIGKWLTWKASRCSKDLRLFCMGG